MHKTRNPVDRKPTWTLLVQQSLERANDFMTPHQLCLATGGTTNQVIAALVHLKSHKVVDSVESNGKLFWFATREDDRLRLVEERVPEEPGSRRPRRTRKA